MLKQVSFEGEITVKFDCGCSVTFEVSCENTLTKVNRKSYASCSEHGGGLLLAVDGEEILEMIGKVLNLPSLYDLLLLHDKVISPASLMEVI